MEKYKKLNIISLVLPYTEKDDGEFIAVVLHKSEFLRIAGVKPNR